MLVLHMPDVDPQAGQKYDVSGLCLFHDITSASFSSIDESTCTKWYNMSTHSTTQKPRAPKKSGLLFHSSKSTYFIPHEIACAEKMARACASGFYASTGNSDSIISRGSRDLFEPPPPRLSPPYWENKIKSRIR